MLYLPERQAGRYLIYLIYLALRLDFRLDDTMLVFTGGPPSLLDGLDRRPGGAG